jgi:SAM-dependent methyltransferase
MTWGWTVDERVQQFLLETDIEPNMCNGKLILDAGSGNGQLSEALTRLGATVVALDYSTSVFGAERRRKAPNVHFIRGDLHAPPFDPNTFDIIISNGVIHHTPNTYKTFIQVAQLAKPGGRFYLWLYPKPERFLKRYLLLPVGELLRTIATRLPRGPQMLKGYVFALMSLHKILGRHKDYPWPERVVGAYDSLTPRWRHYHTPFDVSGWFFKNGFSSPTLTHWDTPYGFGVVATKKAHGDTPV